MSTFEMIVRLVAAALAGGLIGLNRDLHSKQTGVRTLGLVALGAAVASMAGNEIAGGDGATRVMQGIVTGIGFLGAGVIVRPPQGFRIHGLTTAACTWLTACIGIVCGVSDARLIIVAIVLTFIVLIWGGPIEKDLRHRFRRTEDKEPAAPE